MIFLVAAVIVVLLGGAWGWRSSSWVLTGEREPLTTTPRTFGFPFTDETFSSTDGTRLKAWFVPAVSFNDVTLVICHGWGANRSNILERTHFLRARGNYNLFYFDFRNHGHSDEGKTSLSGNEIDDLEMALAHLRTTHPAESVRVGLYGMSMGGAVSLWVAAHKTDVAAVAAESPYSAAGEAVIRYGRLFYRAPRWMSLITLAFVRSRLGFDPDDYAPVRVIDKISPRPLFLLQGGRDARTPPSEGQRLLDAAREPKSLWTLPGADHGELAEMGGKEYQGRLLAFYDGVFRRGL